MPIYRGHPRNVKSPVWRILNPAAIVRRVAFKGGESPELTPEDFDRLRELARETVIRPGPEQHPGETRDLR